MAEPKRAHQPAKAPAPTSLERDEVAADFSDMERDAVDQVVMMATSALSDRGKGVLKACPAEFAEVGPLLAIVLDELGDPTERLATLRRVRAALHRPLNQIALEDGGGQLAQRLEDLLTREEGRLIAHQQRLRVDRSGWAEGKVVDAGDPAAASARLDASLAALRVAAGIGEAPSIHDQVWNSKSTTSDTGVATLGLSIDILEFKTTALLDELIDKAIERGRRDIALTLEHASGKLNGTIGGLAAVVGVAEGAIDLFSSESSTMSKIDGARGLVTNGMQVVGAIAELRGAAWGAGLSAAGTWLTMGYQYLKLVAETVAMGWEARLGLVRATINSKLDQVRDRAAAVADLVDRMQRAHALAEQEPDPAARGALLAYHRELAVEAGALIDRFIGEVEGPTRPHMRYAWSLDEPTMQRLFAPLAARRGLRTPDEVLQSMQLMLEGLAYGVTHGRELAEDMTTGEHA